MKTTAPQAHARRSGRVDHVVRFVTALSMGGLGAVRGCGGGSACVCPADAGVAQSSNAVCSASEQDAGCNTIGFGAGPLAPPELALG